MTALHQDRRTAAAAVDAAFAELELVEELMSIYRPQSQLSRLNRDGVLDSPHPYIVAVLRYAQDLAERTEGAFDVTVQPLWSVYRHAARRGELPQERELAAARAMVGWRRLSVTAERLTLEGGAQITLNGIAQGFAADCALRALRSLGVEHALVDTGELGALGRKANGEKWTVGIQHPRVPDAYISLAQLQRRFLATSGDYATTFSPDFRNHHLFDPRTGRSPEEPASVTIAATTAMEADALSTAVFVLGPERGADLVRRTPGADALLVLKDGAILATDGFPIAAAPS
jgi:thiamine biosynthesis lipoprotein